MSILTASLICAVCRERTIWLLFHVINHSSPLWIKTVLCELLLKVNKHVISWDWMPVTAKRNDFTQVQFSEASEIGGRVMMQAWKTYRQLHHQKTKPNMSEDLWKLHQKLPAKITADFILYLAEFPAYLSLLVRNFWKYCEFWKLHDNYKLLIL